MHISNLSVQVLKNPIYKIQPLFGSNGQLTGIFIKEAKTDDLVFPRLVRMDQLSIKAQQYVKQNFVLKVFSELGD